MGAYTIRNVMKITRKEVAELEEFIQRLEDDREEHYILSTYDSKARAANSPMGSYPWPEPFYAERPHLLLAMGFDEFVALKNKRQLDRMWRWRNSGVDNSPQSIYRAKNGQWHLLFMAPAWRSDTFDFKTKGSVSDDDLSLRIPFVKLLDRLYFLAEHWIPEEKSLLSHVLWTSSLQTKTKATLQASVSTILSSLINENINLADVTWRQLEEIVAEILRMHGLEIYVVKDRPQGGRDIIARGELIPGQEPLEMAVEVKHQATVGRPEVQKALWQNRQYPALLFVTSGRFSAGVFKEKNLPENRLRLFLKDGEALGDLIRDYGRLLI